MAVGEGDTIICFCIHPFTAYFCIFCSKFTGQKHKGQGIYRTLYYLPSIVGESVAVAIVWRTIFGKNGAFEALLNVFGVSTEYSVLGDPNTAIWSLILMSIWQFGSPMLIFLAGLKDIPDTYYEAASIDGASSFQRFLEKLQYLLSHLFSYSIWLCR